MKNIVVVVKNVFSIILSVVVFTSMVSLNVFATDSTSSNILGDCGENATYIYNEKTQVLTISGSGAIGDYAFSCYENDDSIRESISWNVRTIIIEKGITEIGRYAFDCCKSTSIELPDGLETIRSGAFYCCYITAISIPDTVTTIEDAAFNLCGSLVNVKLPSNIEIIKRLTFSGCTKLESINLPLSIKKIEESAFASCCSKNLELNIPCNIELEFKQSGILGSMGYMNSFCGTINVVPNSSQEEYFLNNYGNEISNGKVTLNAELSHIFSNPIEKENGLYVESCSICGEERIFECHKLYWYHTETMGENAYDLVCSYCNENFGRGYLNCDNQYYLYGYVENGDYYHFVYNESADFIGTEKCEIDSWYTDIESHEGVCKCHLILCEETTHKESSWITDINATCVANGSKHKECIVCGDILETKEIPATGHNYSSEWTIDSEATCTSVGTKSHHCINCDNKIDVTTITALGHDFNEGTITKTPTCLVYGEKLVNCQRCSFTKVEIVPPLGHNIEKWTVVREPDYNLAGIKRGECTSCKQVFTETEFLKLDVPRVKYKTTTSGITLEWDKIQGAEYYVIKYSTFDTAKGKWIKSNTTTTTTLTKYSKTLKNGAKYKFEVCAYAPSKDDVFGNFGEYCDGIEISFLSSPIVNGKVQKNGVQLEWESNPLADSYIIYRRTYNAKTKAWGGWTRLADGVTSTSYVDKTAKSGTYYRYTVKAVNEAGNSGYNTSGIKTYFLATPTVSATNSNSGVTVKWTKAAGATGYYVYRKTGTGSWQRVATVKGAGTLSYTDKKAPAGVTYRYTVKAYYSSYVSAYNTNGFAVRRLTTPTLKSVTSAKSGVTFKWNKVTGATGYIVYRKTGNGGWQRIATIKGNTKISYLDKTAKKGVTYKYTVKAYYGTSTSYYNTKGLTIKDKY